jgi:hypothetical protein
MRGAGPGRDIEPDLGLVSIAAIDELAPLVQAL